jgi:glycosyltransferase involved in cell wall biosynthesis
MSSSTFLSVVIPIYNDADILEEVILEVIDAVFECYENYEIVLVDDCSTDHTKAFVEDNRNNFDCVRYIRLSRKFGLEVAIACGLEQIIGDIVVVLRPDSDPPLLIPEFVERAETCNCIVVGRRNVYKNRSYFYWLAYNLYYSICKLLLERPHIYQSTHFIAMTRSSLNALLKIKGSYRYLRVLVTYFESREKINTIRYETICRRNLERHRNIWSLIDECVLLITSNSVRPLRLAGGLAVVGALLNIAYMFYILVNKAFWEVEPGWAAISFQNSIMFSITLFIFSVFCEYLARLLCESKAYPVYYIQEEIQSNTMIRNMKKKNIIHQ